MPTIYDCIGLELPEVVKGFTQIPLEGVSLRSTFESDPHAEGDGVLLDARVPCDLAQGLEGGERASHDRRLGQLRQRPLGALPHRQGPHRDPRPGGRASHQAAELINLWFHEAGRYRGLPLEDRTAVEVLADPTRPQVAPPRDQYVYYPGAAEVPETAAANIRNRSYSIAVEVDIESEDAAGVLFSHGARFGGHGLYIKDRKLKYVYNFVGGEQMVESTRGVGQVLLSAAFVKEGDAMPTTGTLSLFINDEKVGEADHDPAGQLLWSAKA